MEKLLLTPDDAAHVLSIGRSKLYELLATGALRSVRIGTSRRIPLEALAAYVARLTDDGGDDQDGRPRSIVA